MFVLLYIVYYIVRHVYACTRGVRELSKQYSITNVMNFGLHPVYGGSYSFVIYFVFFTLPYCRCFIFRY